jgi:dephospho-CoA kinase
VIKVGLTGSIAVGKSFVLSVFRELGCHVLDADQTAREVVEPGTDGLLQIVEAFGQDILRSDGSLDRAKLGAIVFADESRRSILNAIVHPLVIAAQDRWLETREAEDPHGIAIIDAALMIESGGYRRFDKLIVVWCDESIQLSRLRKRVKLSEAEAQQRIAAQMPQDEKKRFADFLIDTSGSYEETREQVTVVFEQLRGLLDSQR